MKLMKTLLLEITDDTAQIWWSLSFMVFITDIFEIFYVYFSVLDHPTLVMSEYSKLSFQKTKKTDMFIQLDIQKTLIFIDHTV
jgi:hypothetical protein